MAVSIPIQISGEVIATDISYEDFLDKFGNQRAEWINGTVIAMSPVNRNHNAISRFLIMLFDQFLMATTGGEIFHEPMVMRPRPDLPARSPDIQIVLPKNEQIIQENMIAGAADLIVEIVSPESQRRDRYEKFGEYEKAGVKEYWIIDPIRKEILFCQLNDQDTYSFVQPDENGIYHSKVLIGFKLKADIFWRDNLPRGTEISNLVETMLKE